jgi:hypothetical protein
LRKLTFLLITALTVNLVAKDFCEHQVNPHLHDKAAYPELKSTKELENHIQSFITHLSPKEKVFVSVDRYKIVTIYNLKKSNPKREIILQYILHLPDVLAISIEDTILLSPRKGKWFCKEPLFETPIATTTKEVASSASFRNHINNDIAYTGFVSIGDTVPIYRWFDLFQEGSSFEIGVGGAVWANFDLEDISTDLINADYLFQIPFTYSIKNWSYRFRIYHISSHLGDEFMVRNPDIERKNPSFEAIEYLTSLQYDSKLRLYNGFGLIIGDDPKFTIGKMYTQIGLEYKHPINLSYNGLDFFLFYAMDFQFWEIHGFKPFISLGPGIEISTPEHNDAKFRIFLNYYNGYKDGQFFYEPTQCFAFRLSWPH